MNQYFDFNKFGKQNKKQDHSQLEIKNIKVDKYKLIAQDPRNFEAGPVKPHNDYFNHRIDEEYKRRIREEELQEMQEIDNDNYYKIYQNQKEEIKSYQDLEKRFNQKKQQELIQNKEDEQSYYSESEDEILQLKKPKEMLEPVDYQKFNKTHQIFLNPKSIQQTTEQKDLNEFKILVDKFQDVQNDKNDQDNNEKYNEKDDNQQNDNEKDNNKQNDNEKDDNDNKVDIRLNMNDKREQEELQQGREVAEQLGLPISHRLTISGHSKSVSCLAIDRGGGVMVTGSNDYHVKFWNFGAMTKQIEHFRLLDPVPFHVINRLSFNSNYKEILVVAGNAQPAIISREGSDVVEFIKGDQYLKDITKTRGHTAMVTDGAFHKKDANICFTSSMDGTIRTWDRERKLWGVGQYQANKDILKIRNAKGMLVGCTAVAMTSDSKFILGAALDGSIQGFYQRTYYNKPDILINNNSNAGVDGVKIEFMKDDRKFIIRTQQAVKVYDIRNYNAAIAAIFDLPCYHPYSKFTISPDEKYLVVPTSVSKSPGEEYSMIKVFRTTDFNEIYKMRYSQHSITDIIWHQKTNQILMGSTDSNAYVLYNPNLSTKGAMLCALKDNNRFYFENNLYTEHYTPNYFTPYAMPIFKDEPNKRKQYARMRQDQIEGHKPQGPLQGPGKKGIIMGPNSVTQHMLRSIHSRVDKQEDPLQILHKFKDMAENDPKYVDHAYKNTQPQRQYEDNQEFQPEADFLSTIKKFCPHCGLKLCRCNRVPVKTFKTVQGWENYDF